MTKDNKKYSKVYKAFKLKKTSLLAPKKGFPDLPIINGVKFSATHAGIKKQKQLDLMLVELRPGTTIAGALTKSSTCSAPVKWCRNNLDYQNSSDLPLAIIVNSGNANTFTGESGTVAVSKTALEVAKCIGSNPNNVFVASTGVIGETLPVDKILKKISKLKENLKKENAKEAALAILTTDTFPKGTHRAVNIDGKEIKISGFAKGSGMVAPNMATMLVFIFTDVPINKKVLQEIVNQNICTTFNAITVDSDTSTSDTLLVAATGTVDIDPIISIKDSRANLFRTALESLMQELAKLVVRDGEGATKFIEINVRGAKDNESALLIGKAIANSPLVKTAIAGEDPNWGRVIMAIGKEGIPISAEKLKISFGKYPIAEAGNVSKTYSEKEVKEYMRGKEITINVDLEMKSGTATIWTCDLTHEYIAINADYRS